MKKYSKDEILKQHEASSKKMYQATLNGDYKTYNRESERLVKIYKCFEVDKELAKECISEMLKSKNVVARIKAAAYCLALGENIELAEKNLEEISSNKENGIFGFDAEMTLYVWKKNGYLQIYQKK